jgi:hypothetical protein
MSVLFCASADGEKRMALVIIPRDAAIPNLVIPANVMVLFRRSGTFNSEVMMHNFIQQVFMPHVMKQHSKSDHLFRPSTMPQTICFYIFNIKIVHIPAHLTGILQPANVAWLISLKSAYEQPWSRWFMNDPKAFSRFHVARL